MKRHTVKHAKARLATKKGFDIQVLENGRGEFFLAHQPVNGYGAVKSYKL